MARNQFAAVPARITSDVQRYLFRRDSIMQRIEVKDLERRQSEVPDREP